MAKIHKKATSDVPKRNSGFELLSTHYNDRHFTTPLQQNWNAREWGQLNGQFSFQVGNEP